MPRKISYLGHQSRLSATGGAAPSICIRRYICNGRAYTPSHNASDALCMLRTLLTIRKITVGRSAPGAPSVSPRTSEYVYESERARVFSSTRERVNSSAKALRSTRLSRRRRIIFLSPRCALFRRAHRRVHHRPSLRSDAPEDSISVIAVVLEINRKQ